MSAKAKPSGPVKDLLDAAAGTQFKAILADPPWRFQNKTGKVAPEHLPVAGLASPTAHLYLWCPNALLPDGLCVMAAWGFTYKANIVLQFGKTVDRMDAASDFIFATSLN